MKSETDLHWNERALSVKDDLEVNIMDIFQRDLEYDYVCRFLKRDMSVVEAGCGNGYSTAKFRTLVRHIDAFDFSEAMVMRAIERFGETNNRFIHDNVLNPTKLAGPYDAAVCIRVLINLQSLSEQQLALRNLGAMIRPGGLLLLAEGFKDGFAALNGLRARLDLTPIEPAGINFYSWMGEVMPELLHCYQVEEKFHLGAYDYLTRVVYPMMVGAENVKHNTVFSEKAAQLARAYNPDAFKGFSRMRLFALRKGI